MKARRANSCGSLCSRAAWRAGDALLPLAHADPSFGAWLIDLVTGGALHSAQAAGGRGDPERVAWGNVRPATGRESATRLAQTTATSLLPAFMAALELRGVDLPRRCPVASGAASSVPVGVRRGPAGSVSMARTSCGRWLVGHLSGHALRSRRSR